MYAHVLLEIAVIILRINTTVHIITHHSEDKVLIEIS